MEFSDEQKRIIEHFGGHELVIACPGSGKTTTILKKVERMVLNGINPRRILVVTFTKAAATDMSEKFAKNYSQIQGVCFSTIHAICFSILKNEYALTQYNILKEWEAMKYYKMYLKEFIASPNLEDAAKEVIGKISSVRNAGGNPYAIFGETLVVGGEEIPFTQMYQGYEQLKKMQNKIDFDDMLILCVELFKTRPDLLQKYQSYYDYIIIDEYQDTNKIQAKIFYQLSAVHGNLCVVGDDDQSIYGFRSADSSIMLHFSKKFPDTTKFTLSRNYRCGKKIVKYADNLIRNNKERFSKKFEAGTDFEGDIFIGSYTGENEEIISLVNWIKAKESEGVPLKELAILYRTNNEAINMMPFFKKNNIPISMKERPGDIHKHFVFEAIQSYYVLSQMIREDDEHPLPADAAPYMRKIVNCPARYVKPEFFENCDLSGLSINRCIKKYAEADKKVDFRRERIYSTLIDLREDLLTMKSLSPKRFLRNLASMGFQDWIKDQAKYRGVSYENVKGIYENIVSEGFSFDTMKEWMDYTGEFDEYLETAAQNNEGVRLSTFHGAKGLEWTCVWTVNINDKNVPFKRSVDEGGQKGLEEERRMFYVAITRAKKELHMSYVKIPSSFLVELFGKENQLKITELDKQINFVDLGLD